MYGPVATWWMPYVDNFPASNRPASSSGTGADNGMESAPASTTPAQRVDPGGRSRSKTTVWPSGVVMPGSRVPGATPAFAPRRPPKYAPA
jgi:hypothetical protein